MSHNIYHQYADRTAQRYGVDPRLVAAVIQQESGWNPSARSGAGALGLMQLMPGTARGLGVDPMNWQQNIDGGVRYLAEQLKRFKRPDLALSAYNSGPGGSEASGRVEGFPETQNYVRKVIANMGLGGGADGPALSAGGGPTLSGGGSQPGDNFLFDVMGAFQNKGKARTNAILGAILGQGDGLAASSAPAPGSVTTPAGAGSPAGAYGAQAMVAVIDQARRMGLAVSENPYAGDKVDPVHTKGSHHYRTIGTQNGVSVGGGADISGDAAKLRALFSWIRQRYPKIPELIYDPIGSIFDGTFKPGAYGGHGQHLHTGF